MAQGHRKRPLIKRQLAQFLANHSNILAGRIPWTEKPGGLQFHGVTRVGHHLATKPPPPAQFQEWLKEENGVS